jgi:hypothetical protein
VRTERYRHAAKQAGPPGPGRPKVVGFFYRGWFCRGGNTNLLQIGIQGGPSSRQAKGSSSGSSWFCRGGAAVREGHASGLVLCSRTAATGRYRVTALVYPTKTARQRSRCTSCARPDEVSAPADAQPRRSACAERRQRRVRRHSGPPLLRCALPARPRCAARLHGMSGAPSSSRVQPIAAAAPPGDRKKRRVAVAKSVSTRHTSKHAHRVPAQNDRTCRPCALRVLHRPRGGARATNMEPASRVRAQRAHTPAGGSTAHAARNAGCAHCRYAARSALADARALYRAG